MAVCRRCWDAEKIITSGTAAEQAARNNHSTCLEALLDDTERVHEATRALDRASSKALDRALIQAASFGNLDCVDLLLRKEADVNWTDIYGESPLIHACRYGFSDVARSLIAARANVNHVSNRGMTALTFAAARENNDIVKVLLESGADVNLIATTKAKYFYIHGPNGNYLKSNLPIFFSLRNPQCLRKMIQMGADVNKMTGDSSGVTALMIAAAGCRLPYCNQIPGRRAMHEVLTILLNEKADLLKVDARGETAFSHAILRRGKEELRLLLHAAKDIDLADTLSHQNLWGKNCLIAAAETNYLGMVQMVLGAGVRVNCQSYTDHTALSIHMTSGCAGQVVRLLLAAGEEPPKKPVAGSGITMNRSFTLPPHLLELDCKAVDNAVFPLKCIVRKFIRKQLLREHDNRNLFCTVPKLDKDLPMCIIEYLLYEVSLTEESALPCGRCHDGFHVTHMDRAESADFSCNFFEEGSEEAFVVDPEDDFSPAFVYDSDPETDFHMKESL